MAKSGRGSGWTLGVMDLSGEALVARTRIIILTWVNFWLLHMSRFPTSRSLWKESWGSENAQMEYQYLKTHYDVCRQRIMWRISFDHCGSSEINYGLHSWLPVLTSGGWIS